VWRRTALVQERCSLKANESLEKKFANEKAAFHKAEIEKWWPIIKSANIKAE
jgi:hypothetical protein